MISTRLIDVFLDGPFQIYVGTIIQNKFLKFFMIYTGISNILFNGHNYLCIDLKKICIEYGGYHPVMGKYQIHRLYNLLIMYPIFYFASQQPELPQSVRLLLLLNIIIGFLYNLYYFIQYLTV